MGASAPPALCIRASALTLHLLPFLGSHFPHPHPCLAALQNKVMATNWKLKINHYGAEYSWGSKNGRIRDEERRTARAPRKHTIAQEPGRGIMGAQTETKDQASLGVIEIMKTEPTHETPRPQGAAVLWNKSPFLLSASASLAGRTPNLD